MTMNLDTYFKDMIHEAVRTAVREELSEAISELMATRLKSESNRQFLKKPGMPDKYVVRPNELCKMLSVSSSTLWRMEKEGRLPEKVKIGPRAVGWFNTDIDEWLEQNKMTTSRLD